MMGKFKEAAITAEDEAINAICAGIEAGMNLYHKSAKDAGWWYDIHRNQPCDMTDPHVRATKCGLIASEVFEAFEAIRLGSMDDKLPHRPGDEVELADAVIRILDYCKAYNLDLAGAIREKHVVNKTRADHKMEARLKGGKKF